MNTKYWLGSLALAALAVSASAQVPYSTNFESPYVIGSAGGQQNLIADENSLNFQTGLFRVNNALAFSGTQSVSFDSSFGQWGSSYLFREANFQPSGGLNKIVVSSRVFVNTVNRDLFLRPRSLGIDSLHHSNRCPANRS